MISLDRLTGGGGVVGSIGGSGGIESVGVGELTEKILTITYERKRHDFD